VVAETRAKFGQYRNFSRSKRMIKTQLWVRQEFDAAHNLKGTFPPSHQCARLHGHRYTVTLTIESNSKADVLVDYHEMHAGLGEILAKYDHRTLNDVMDKPTTCENLAREIFARAKERWNSIISVDVQEQTNTGCRVMS
jgi:6-pyruvoyltetrahydropterin/6-carboxytetrahydropterin synthase